MREKHASTLKGWGWDGSGRRRVARGDENV